MIGPLPRGGAGVCRINRGPTIQLDCTCQQLTIGNLNFQVVDYGGAIHLNEFTQKNSEISQEMDGINAPCWLYRRAWYHMIADQKTYLPGAA